ncbi:class I adenylate-forming enzyme family protein [Streptomyces rhizosphaericus]|uniref:class I adenylate-forming enzyme family protein n=1 Tax=Streptomyces rhizosphaericus TaxID=114699 RepID=UPI00117FB10B|nr:AMP-binding protein [Streptomyces rhizosphaericus]
MPVGTGRKACRTVLDALWHAVVAAPDQVALRQGGRSLTYRQYDRCVAGLAADLDRIGVAGKRVALALPNGPEMAVAVFAALSAGAQIAFFNPNYPRRELQPLLADAAPAALLAPPGSEGAAAALAVERRIPVLSLGTAQRNLEDWSADPDLTIADRARPAPDDLATLMYTGGTTGVPKGVVHSHRNLMLTVQAMEACWPTRVHEDVWVTVAPMYHIWGLLMGILNPVYGRATLVSVPRFQPDLVVEALARHKATVFSGGPAAVYSGLLAASAFSSADLSHLRICPGGGSSFPLDLLRRWQEATGVEIQEALGMSEIAPISSQVPGRPPIPGSVGHPAPLIDVRIASDNSSEPLEIGEVGEILVRAPHMFLEYHNDPDATEAAFVDGWFRTGDLGRLDGKGVLYVVDRKKDLIIVGGFNVFPREIDELLASHRGVRQAVTVGIPDARKGERPASFVVALPGHTVHIQELHDFCAQHLVSYKRPAVIRFVDEIPITHANKPNRQALRAQVTSQESVT